jgi:ABC-2 type transport system permease protein
MQSTPASLLRSTQLLLEWRFLRRRRELIPLLVLQTLISAGAIVGIGFVLDVHAGSAAFFAVTGTATINLAVAGLVLGPQHIAASREQGTFDSVLALPVPRVAILLADCIDTVIWATPGLLLALGFGALRYDFDINWGLGFVGAVLLIALTGAGVGYAMAMISPSTQITYMLSQVSIFGLFLFSPLLFPAERMPAAARIVHELLPVKHMGSAMRSSLSPHEYGSAFGPMLILTAWCALSLFVAARALARRA